MLTRAGGANTVIHKDENHISPAFLLENVNQAVEIFRVFGLGTDVEISCGCVSGRYCKDLFRPFSGIR